MKNFSTVVFLHIIKTQNLVYWKKFNKCHLTYATYELF